MKHIFPYVFLLVTTLLACAVPHLDDPPLIVTDDPKAGHGVSSGTAGSVASGQPSSAPTAIASDPSSSQSPPSAVHWHGAFASTPAVPFGGGSACDYRITLRQVSVEIVTAAGGEILSATVKASASEEVLSKGCPNAPIPQHEQTWVLTSASTSANGDAHLELAPLATNHPPSSLVIEGPMDAPSSTLTLAWHRTDYGAPLDWRIAASVTVGAS